MRRQIGGVAAIAVLAGALVACSNARIEEPTPAWQQVYRPFVQYINATGTPLPVRRAPDGTSEIIGSVEPGRGGLIQNCDGTGADPLRYCRVAVGALNALGWVDMAAMAPRG